MRRAISSFLLLAVISIAVVVAAACTVPVDIDWGTASGTTSGTGTETPTPLPGTTKITTTVSAVCVPVTSADLTTITVPNALPVDWVEPFDAFLHQTQDLACSNTGTSTCDMDGEVVASIVNGSSDDAPVPVSAGRGELVRVTSVAAGVLTLESPLVAGNYASSVSARAQLCYAFSFESLTIASGGHLVATPWDGAAGGIIAIKVESLVVDAGGSIDASGAGFRGGTDGVPGPLPDSTSTIACSESGGRGEGWAGRSSDCGLMFFASGGGGGNPSLAGGGGGGNAGGGGDGGRGQSSMMGIEGLGGMAVYGAPALQLGGGGGAGMSGAAVTGAGGAGGGLIVIVADTITGAGQIRADGATGGCSPTPGCDIEPPTSGQAGGSSGGGAGGTISVSAASIGTLTLSAVGGNGGDVRGTMAVDGWGGTGGGGGAGRIIGATGTNAPGAKGFMAPPGMENNPSSPGFGPGLPGP